MSYLKKRVDSFKWAFNGLKIVFCEEANARIHLLATIVVIALGLFLGIDRYEWITVLIAIAMVIAAEIFNTAIEHLSDFVSPEKRAAIKKVKDLAAAGVLVTAIVAVVVGVIIFMPRLLTLL